MDNDIASRAPGGFRRTAEPVAIQLHPERLATLGQVFDNIGRSAAIDGKIGRLGTPPFSRPGRRSCSPGRGASSGTRDSLRALLTRRGRNEHKGREEQSISEHWGGERPKAVGEQCRPARVEPDRVQERGCKFRANPHWRRRAHRQPSGRNSLRLKEVQRPSECGSTAARTPRASALRGYVALGAVKGAGRPLSMGSSLMERGGAPIMEWAGRRCAPSIASLRLCVNLDIAANWQAILPRRLKYAVHSNGP